jgi:prophage regulatory protein
MSHSILRRDDVLKKIGLGKSCLYELQARGEFPKSISLGGRSVGWLESEVNAWIEERIAESRKAA